jgi:hypothetical protein
MGAKFKDKYMQSNWPDYKKCPLCYSYIPSTITEPCKHCISRYGKELATFKYEEKILREL